MRGSRLIACSWAAAVLLSGAGAGADDFQVIRLEQDMRNLEREVQTLQRRWPSCASR